MKRLIAAAVIAIGIHGLLLSMDSDWLNLAEFRKPSTGSVTITLEAIQRRTVKPKIDPLPPHRYPQEINKIVVEKIPISETPAAPAMKQKPVKTIKKPEIKKSPSKSVSAKPKRQDKPQESAPPEPVPQTSLKSVPDDSPQSNDTHLPPLQEEPTGLDRQPVAASSNQAASPPAVEEAIPEYQRNPPISYPKRARRKGYEGTVVLEVLVNRNGKVDDLRILISSGYDILDSTAVRSVKKWSFKPAKKGKEAVDMWVRVPVKFLLQ